MLHTDSLQQTRKSFYTKLRLNLF